MATTVFTKRWKAIPRHHPDPCSRWRCGGSRYHDKILVASPDRSHIWKRMHGEFSSHCFSRPGGVSFSCQGQLLHRPAPSSWPGAVPNEPPPITNPSSCVGPLSTAVLGVQHSHHKRSKHYLPFRNRFFAHAALTLKPRLFVAAHAASCRQNPGSIRRKFNRSKNHTRPSALVLRDLHLSPRISCLRIMMPKVAPDWIQ